MKLSDQGIKNLAEALSKFQGEVKNPHNEAINPQFRSKYAPLDVVINTVKPLLAKYGLSFIQSTSTNEENVGITTLLIHESGEWIESDTLFLPAYQLKSGGAKEFNAQAIGSSTTYGRRYSLSAILGLSSEDDDDANGQVFGGGATTQSKKTTETPPPNARETAIAKAKANALVNAQENATPPQEAGQVVDDLPWATTDATNEVPSESATIVEPANEAQQKAILSMINLIGKKRKDDPNFNQEAFLSEVLSKFGKDKVENLSFDQAKEVVVIINTKMREKL
jgi:hypothetical protein